MVVITPRLSAQSSLPSASAKYLLAAMGRHRCEREMEHKPLQSPQFQLLFQLGTVNKFDSESTNCRAQTALYTEPGKDFLLVFSKG